MGEWKKVKLGDCIKEVVEKTTKNNQHQVLSVTKDGIFSQEEFFKKQIASENNIGYKVIRRNNIVFSTMNLWMGSLDVLTNYDIGIVSPAYKIFKFNEELMLPSYGKYFMKSYYMLEQYKNCSEQGASVVRRNLDLKALLNISIEIPSIHEQQKIVDILKKVDQIIEIIKKEIKQHINYKNNIINNISDEHSKDVIIDEVFDKITDYVAAGSFADLKNNVQYKSNKDYAQLIRTIDIKSKFKNTESVYISKTAFEFLWRVNLTEDNIVLPNIGANIGEVYYLKKDDLPFKNNVLGPNAILLGKSEILKYMYYYFQSSDFQKKLKLIVGASGQPKFNKTDLRKIKIKIPSSKKQKKIINVLEKNDKIISLLIQKNEKYEKLKKGLMQQLLTGKIKVRI